MSITPKMFLALIGLVAVACTPVPNVSKSTERDFIFQGVSEISFIGKAKLIVHSDIPLDPDTEAAFGRFKNGMPAFGAMYVQPNGSGWSSHTEILSLQNARHLSKTACDLLHDNNCVLYASLDAENSNNSSALHQSERDLIAKAKRETRPGNYIVVSTNKLGNVGVSWDEQNLIAGSANAAKDCDAEAEQFRKTNRDNRADIRVDRHFSRLGVFDCDNFFAYLQPE